MRWVVAVFAFASRACRDIPLRRGGGIAPPSVVRCGLVVALECGLEVSDASLHRPQFELVLELFLASEQSFHQVLAVIVVATDWRVHGGFGLDLVYVVALRFW